MHWFVLQALKEGLRIGSESLKTRLRQFRGIDEPARSKTFSHIRWGSHFLKSAFNMYCPNEGGGSKRLPAWLRALNIPSCNGHFLYQGGGGVRTLVRVVWGTFLLLSHQGSNGILLFPIKGDQGPKKVPKSAPLTEWGGGSKVIWAMLKQAQGTFQKGASHINFLLPTTPPPSMDFQIFSGKYEWSRADRAHRSLLSPQKGQNRSRKLEESEPILTSWTGSMLR